MWQSSSRLWKNPDNIFGIYLVAGLTAGSASHCAGTCFWHCALTLHLIPRFSIKLQIIKSIEESMFVCVCVCFFFFLQTLNFFFKKYFFNAYFFVILIKKLYAKHCAFTFKQKFVILVQIQIIRGSFFVYILLS